ncbi:PP2C family serine/threonine-protein phosphatase [Actinocorallia longicatena]|uniref:Stp1/IreP family PP2C-type Ser/Thr phosphatase n=1 Tax=Actinocorallia longicatena TaxID=111803 RepID=A0ABP6QA76_9ACTN
MSTQPRIGIRYAARSDVGMLREGNEDSAVAGARLLAVADGMGGHVGGEIASAEAIETLRKLDTDVPADQLLVALEHSVRAANEALRHRVEGDPSLQGMGTTLTAMLWSGSQVALVHIGDSRAYLLRNGELFQITHDHTLVQSLVDEGRISLDDAATHPQRSLLLRALDGRSEVEPDLSLREAQVGDRYLLCSDGLSGVVSAETIHQVLTAQPDPEQAIRQLIDLANRGGGPDNITCVVADVINLDETPPAEGRQVLAGAAASKAQEAAAAGAPGPLQADSPALRARDHIRDTLPQPPLQLGNSDYVPPPAPAPYPGDQGPYQQEFADYGEPQQFQGAPPVAPPPGHGTGPQQLPPRPGGGGRSRGTKGPLLLGAVGVVGLLVIGAGYFGYKSFNSGFYLAQDGKEVALYEGTTRTIPLLGSPAGKAKDQPKIAIDDLPKPQQDRVKKKIKSDTKKGIAAEIDKLRKSVCVFTIQNRENNAVIVKGAGQEGCTEIPVSKAADDKPLPGVDTRALPNEDRDKLGAMPFSTLETATRELERLKSVADNCQDNPGVNGCPKPPKS